MHDVEVRAKHVDLYHPRLQEGGSLLPSAVVHIVVPKSRQQRLLGWWSQRPVNLSMSSAKAMDSKTSTVSNMLTPTSE